jgi:hypothetical protein
LGAQRGRDVLAVGFYGLGDLYVQENVSLGDSTGIDVLTDFDYTSLAYERLVIDTKRWQVGFPVSVGLGNYRRSIRGADGTIRAYSTNELVPLEISLHADYNVFYWLFIGVGGGYRHVLAADREATIALSDRTYYLKAGVRVGEIIKRARSKYFDHHGS